MTQQAGKAIVHDTLTSLPAVIRLLHSLLTGPAVNFVLDDADIAAVADDDTRILLQLLRDFGRSIFDGDLFARFVKERGRNKPLDPSMHQANQLRRKLEHHPNVHVSADRQQGGHWWFRWKP